MPCDPLPQLLLSDSEANKRRFLSWVVLILHCVTVRGEEVTQNPKVVDCIPSRESGGRKRRRKRGRAMGRRAPVLALKQLLRAGSLGGWGNVEYTIQVCNHRSFHFAFTLYLYLDSQSLGTNHCCTNNTKVGHSSCRLKPSWSHKSEGRCMWCKLTWLSQCSWADLVFSQMWPQNY